MSDVSHVPPNSVSARLVGGPVGFRKLLQRLGPTYVKLGQFLALRPDVIPDEYVDELLRLLDQGPPFPWSEARSIVTDELGADPSELFAYVNPRPVAAGSLAQVHFARLKDGREVAIKIQRPGIRERVIRDLSQARFLARVLEIGRVQLIVPPSEVVEELRTWMLQELDFGHELENMAMLHELAHDDVIQRIPRPYPRLSSGRVLTADYIRGIPFTELLVALRSSDPAELARLSATGLDLDRLAENLLRATLTQVFRYQFFHADLHPGNLLALPGDRIGFVDFGLCDELEATVRENQVRYLSAVYSRDVDQMFAALLDLLIPSEESDIAAFRRDFVAETRTFIARITSERPQSPVSAADETRSPIAGWMVTVVRIARKHRMRLPPRVLSMYRTLLTAESVAHQLGSSANLRVVGRDFFANLRIEEALRVLDPENLQASALVLLSLLRDSPAQLHQILSELSDGRFALGVRNVEAPHTSRLRNRRTALLTTAILSVGVALLLASLIVSAASDPIRWIVGGFLGFLYVLVAVQWRRLG